MVAPRLRAVAILAVLVASIPGGPVVAQEGRVEDAPAAAEEQAPPDWSAIFQAVQAGRCPEAVPLLESYVLANPEAARAFYFLGFCQGRGGHDPEALAALDRAAEIRPDMEGVAVMRGKLLLRLGRPVEAEQAFRNEIGVAATPEILLEAWTALADQLTRSARNIEAREAWGHVIDLAPTQADAYAQASALDLKLDRLEDADAVLVRGEEAGVLNPAARLNVGIAAFNKKDAVRAGAIFRAVAESASAPKDVASAWALLSKVQMRDGNKQEAAASIRKSLEADPDGPMAAELKDSLKKLESGGRRK